MRPFILAAATALSTLSMPLHALHAADMRELLEDGASTQQILDYLSGETLVDLDGDFLNSADSRFVVFLLGRAAAQCGFAPTFELGDPKRIVRISQIENPTGSDVLLELQDVADKFGVRFGVDTDELATSLAARLAAGGLASVQVVDQASVSLLVYLVDGSHITDHSQAANFFLTFNAIAGLEPQTTPNDENKYAYLLGGGELEELVGAETDSSSRLCFATTIVHALCRGIAPDKLTEQLPSIDTTCSPGSDGAKEYERMASEYNGAERNSPSL